MNNLLDMQRKMSNRFHDKFKRFCDPLVYCFGVNHFYHFKLSHSRHLVNIGLHRDWEQLLLSSKLVFNWPTFQKNESFQPDIVFLKLHDDENKNLIWEKASKEFNIHYTIELINRTNEGIEGFGFGLKTQDPIRQALFLKELPLLKLFIKQYLKEFQSDIPSFRNYEVDIDGFLDPCSIPSPSLVNETQRHRFLKEMRVEIPISLTSREMDIGRNLMKGYSASEIGDKLFISKRTVEHHIERIKDKWDCSKKSDLIQKFYELQSIGYI